MYYEVNISLFGLCVISGVADIRFSTKVLTNLSSFQLYLCLRQRKHLPCNLAIFNILFFPQYFSASAPLPRTDFSSYLPIFYFTALPIFYVTALAVNIPFQGFSRPNIKTTLSTGNSNGFKLLTVYNDFSHSAVRSEK